MGKKDRRKHKRILISALLTAVLLLAQAVTPAAVSAAPNFKTAQTFYLTNQNGAKAAASYYVGNLSKSQTIKKKHITVQTGQSVVKLIFR